MTAQAVAIALGGRRTLHTEVHSDLDLVTAVMHGISADAAAEIVESGMLSTGELYELIIPRRTFDRRREDKQPLTIVEADRLLRAVRVIVRAIDALGTADKAKTWLRTANRSLRGLVPLTLLETDIGARMVERTLGRIEHGVYS